MWDQLAKKLKKTMFMWEKKRKETKTQKIREKKIVQATPLGIDAGRGQGRHRAHLTAAMHRAHLTAAGQAGLPGARAKSRAHGL